MEVNSIGMAFNIAVPVIFLSSFMSKEDRQNFAILLLFSYAASLASGRTTLYCIVVVPTFWVSVALLPVLEETESAYSSVPFMIVTLSTAVAIAIAKVNICMSVCLHRYASHAAFKCGPVTRLGVSLLGCLANQGGPIWWASQHRCHHKNCDAPRDPHSPIVSGTEKAFGFFRVHSSVLEEFAPPHLESVTMRVIDTWAWVIVTTELLLSYHWMGRTGLFLAYASGWLCQTMTLWFNIANHPAPPKFVTKDGKTIPSLSSSSSGNIMDSKSAFHAQCNASDGNEVDPWNDPCLVGGGVYLPFVLLSALTPLFGSFVMEMEHGHHHEHPSLAKRSPGDIAYWGFVYPLEKAGLIWNVVVPESKKIE